MFTDKEVLNLLCLEGIISHTEKGYLINRNNILENLPRSYGFEQIAITQNKNICNSRLDVDISSEILREVIRPIPLIASNMSTVTNAEFCIKLFELGALGIMHRAADNQVLINETRKIADKCSIVAVSIGVGNGQYELCKELVDAGANIITIDIAHGYSDRVIELGRKIKQELPAKLIVGNTINTDMMEEVDDFADAVKVGLATGCFGAGTRILMANGDYKNIEDIQIGEYVIDKEGKPTKVLNSFCTGIKKTLSVRNNIFYANFNVTPEHLFYSGNISTISPKTLESCGCRKILSKRTRNKQSKIDWHKISNNIIALTPRKIDFQLHDDFKIELQKRIGGNWRSKNKYKVDIILTPSYELGYIFGTFLGDGTAHCSEYKQSKRGSCSWCFGKDEYYIAKKLQKYIKTVFNKTSKIKKANNTINVHFYYKPFADFLKIFGKRENKHLPNFILVNNTKYLKGLYDGLLDSDGHITKDSICSIANTSIKIIELHSVIHQILFGYFPNQLKLKKAIGNLQGTKIENIKQGYSSASLKRPERRLINNYQIVKILNKDINYIEIPVYDLTTESHSFIANNCIVHNSVCETKNTAACIEKQFSAIYKFKDISKKLGLPIISDGGIREAGDFVKALAAGSNSAMAGSIFARCPESAAPTIHINGEFKKLFSGMSSRWVQNQWKNGLKKGTCPEGTVKYLDMGEPVENLLERYSGALRSGITYAGGNDINSFHQKVRFVRI